MTDEVDLVSLREAAARLERPLSTVGAWVRNGVLKAEKREGRWLVRADALRRFARPPLVELISSRGAVYYYTKHGTVAVMRVDGIRVSNKVRAVMARRRAG